MRLSCLASADAEVDPEADALDGARTRALTDHAATEPWPGANAAHAADGASGPSDPLLRGAESQADEVRHAAASRWRRWWRRRRRRWWRRRRRRWRWRRW